MKKLRKMLGDANSPECAACMRQMETQSKKTLAAWSMSYARKRYLPIFAACCPEDSRVAEKLQICENAVQGLCTLKEAKAAARDLRQTAQELSEHPLAQAAARAISTACSTIQTPTGALGFLFYGAAAVAYDTAGLSADAAEYDALATEEFRRALKDLQAASVPDEPSPAVLKWNC